MRVKKSDKQTFHFDKEIKMIGYIYRYRNKINGKVYIGQTIDIERRKIEHIKSSENGTGFAFHRALRKYGYDSFEFDILHIVKEDEPYFRIRLDELEIKEIQRHHCLVPQGYNIAYGGQGGDNGKLVHAWAQTEEGKQRIKKRSEDMKASKPRLHKICEECGVAYLAKSNKSKFCSASCRNQNYNREHLDAERYKVNRICKRCGKPFRAYKYDVEKGRGLYCSYSCSRLSRAE
jgi:group I intron endonuclease